MHAMPYRVQKYAADTNPCTTCRAVACAGGEAPPTAVAAAMGLVRSALLAGEGACSGSPAPALPDAGGALMRRFGQAQAAAAFAHLRSRGHVCAAQSRRPFQLSDAFREALQARFRVLRDFRISRGTPAPVSTDCIKPRSCYSTCAMHLGHSLAAAVCPSQGVGFGRQQHAFPHR